MLVQTGINSRGPRARQPAVPRGRNLTDRTMVAQIGYAIFLRSRLDGYSNLLEPWQGDVELYAGEPRAISVS